MPSRRKGRPAPGRHLTVLEPRLLPDWEAAHVFLEVARSASFRAASEKLHQSVNALRRKVDELEARMGLALLLRRAHGVTLTEEGRKVYQAAVAMEKASFDLVKAQGESGENSSGEVTVAVTEGLGTFWLAPRLPELRSANPGHRINLVCAPQSADVTRLEADIVLRLDRPKSSELKISKLGRLHLMFYAHQRYLSAHGAPAHLKDLAGHHFIAHSDDKGKWVGAERHFFPDGVPPDAVKLRTNVGSANGWAIFSGGCLGVLPTYIQTVQSDMVALDLAPPFPLDIWITYHADAKKIPRVRKTIDWLTQAFDPRRNPWFRDEFVHPRKFSGRRH